MTESVSTELPAVRPLWFRLLRTVAVCAFFAVLFTWLLRISNRSLSDTRPAGFGMGVLHGICMPATLPYLLFGQDVPIFAEHSTGRTYKLGITVGINAAGIIFIGGFQRRIQRVRRQLAALAAREGPHRE